MAFIISNEFCERFNYYGMRSKSIFCKNLFNFFLYHFNFPLNSLAILVLYLTNKLHYSADTATVLFHIFTMLVYLFPLIGAIIADSWLGKFRTILYLSVVYAVGGVIVSIGAVPTLQLPVK